MTNLDGTEHVHFIKASSRHVPVVALTGEEEKVSDLFDQVFGQPFYSRDPINTIVDVLRRGF